METPSRRLTRSKGVSLSGENKSESNIKPSCADEEPKIDVEDPKADELEEPNKEVEVLAPNAGVVEPNMEDDVEPKRLDVVNAPKGEEPNEGADKAPKPELPKAGVFEVNGLEDVGDEKGFADG
ncbi:Uncharacterized protein Fot_57128 [Forsythia ovata]|uniref:Uncharacterized protein n=1 Tax=Forsythia ovata TaxID=205694 RepID=A0ABD1NWM2_9LAMI